MRAIAVIPARLASTRLSRKPLRRIRGRPMIELVYWAAKASPLLADVIVATDSPDIYDLCEANGWRAAITSAGCRSGTDRVYEVARREAADIYVNIQGDEPMARPEHVASLLEVMRAGVQVGTLKTPISAAEARNPNSVKIVTAADGRALYFSRAPVPYDRDCSGAVRYFKHLGFYAYTQDALARFVHWPESTLERSERLEQLRFLENGVDVYVAETPFDTIGVDTEEDLRRVEELLG
ncbi:MAG: 3-deoxy-manno-octulosonate cytidylyltransferase [Deltaproteobacteria bacterium]